MKLNEDPMEQLAGSKTKLKLLRFFLTDGRPSSEREIAERLGVSHMAVNKTMQELRSANLVESTMVGKSKVWTLNMRSQSYSSAMLLKGFLSEPAPIHPLKALLSKEMSSIPSLKSAYIIGSVAEKNELPSSDLDVLIMTKSGANKEKVSQSLGSLGLAILERFGNRLSPLILAEGEPASEKWLKTAVEKGIKILPQD